MDIRDNLLVSSNILYHYLSGKSNEVLVLDEWNSITDADESIKTRGDRRKKGWPTKKTREEFQKKFGKYWAGLPVFAWCSIVAFAIQWLVFIPAWFSHSEKFFDLTGSLSFIAIVIMALVTTGDPDPRAYLLGGMVLVWATRLGTFLFTRVRTAGSDSRFDEMKYRLPSFLLTWTLQGLWVLMTGASAIAAITSHNLSLIHISEPTRPY